MPLSESELRDLFVGLDYEVPLFDGTSRPYVNLDNSATTPPFASVLDQINKAACWYSSVHRGAGFKSRLSTHVFDQCRERFARFLGIDESYHTVIFSGTATDAINRLGCRFPLESDEVVLTSVMEHHANLLPWRFHGKVDHVNIKLPSGAIDLEDMEKRLREHNGKVRLVTVTGASNVTGLLPPLKKIARLAHEYGAQFLVDASQLVAHRPIEMGKADDPERIDFLVFSGHKMYAPFGSGALVGPRQFFEEGEPAMLGGGAVDYVTLDEVGWTTVPEKEEAGTPNLLGIYAIAKAMESLEAVGMDNIRAHERALVDLALKRLGAIDGVRVIGADALEEDHDRLGVVPFHVEAYEHPLLAAILSHEWGIGVRNGCFCAQPYVKDLLDIDDDGTKDYIDQLRQGDRGHLPGLNRASFALYTTRDEVEYLAHAMESILENGPRGKYQLDNALGEYTPEGCAENFDSFLL